MRCCFRPQADLAECIIRREGFEYPVAHAFVGQLELKVVDWNAVSAIAEIIGALVVVASLIYIAVQIRQNSTLLKQNTEFARASIVHETNVSGTQIYELIAQDKEVAEIFRRGINGDILDDTELLRFEALLNMYCSWLEDVESQFEADLYFDEDDEGDLLDYMAPYFKRLFRSQAAKNWWEREGHYQFTPSFDSKFRRIMSADWTNTDTDNSM